MPSDMEVLEWNINIPYAKLTTMVKFLDDSKGENGCYYILFFDKFYTWHRSGRSCELPAKTKLYIDF